MEGLILAHSLSAHSLSRWGRYGGRSMRRCVCYQEVEMNTDDQLIFSFLFSLGPQPMGWFHPHLGLVFLPQFYLSLVYTIPTAMPRDLFSLWL